MAKDPANKSIKQGVMVGAAVAALIGLFSGSFVFIVAAVILGAAFGGFIASSRYGTPQSKMRYTEASDEKTRAVDAPSPDIAQNPNLLQDDFYAQRKETRDEERLYRPPYDRNDPQSDYYAEDSFRSRVRGDGDHDRGGRGR